MVKKCNACGLVRNYPERLNECPDCNGVLQKADIKEYIMYMYNKGISLKVIAKSTNMKRMSAFNIIDKELRNNDEVPRYVQMEFVEKIYPLITSRDWDRRLKSVKEQLPEDCSYETIMYVINSTKRERAESYKSQLMSEVRQAILEELSIDDIKSKTNANAFVIENTIVDMICEKTRSNKNFDVRKSPYIQSEYMERIIEVASNTWNGELRTLKASLPEDCSYITIKAVLALNGLLHI